MVEVALGNLVPFPLQDDRCRHVCHACLVLSGLSVCLLGLVAFRASVCVFGVEVVIS
jgi:hypothetical protein